MLHKSIKYSLYRFIDSVKECSQKTSRPMVEWLCSIFRWQGWHRLLFDICSGCCPVFCIFHQISGYQADVGGFIWEDSNHAGTASDLSIQPFYHVAWRDFSRIQVGIAVEHKRIFQTFLQTLHCLWISGFVFLYQGIGALPCDCIIRSKPNGLQFRSEGFLLLLWDMCQDVPHKVNFAALPGCSGETTLYRRNKPFVCIADD